MREDYGQHINSHQEEAYQALELLLEDLVPEDLSKGGLVGAIGLLVGKSLHSSNEQRHVVIRIVRHSEREGVYPKESEVELTNELPTNSPK